MMKHMIFMIVTAMTLQAALPTLNPATDLYNQRVLLRLDWNVPVQNGVITDTTRLRHTQETLQFLRDKGAKILILSHFGRPTKAAKAFQETRNATNTFIPEPAFSLRPLIPQIERIINIPLAFVENPLETDPFLTLNAGEVCVSDNTRFFGGEEANDLTLAKQWAHLGDLYINDAFSCSHRAHASVTGIPLYLKSLAGFGLAKEMTYLTQALSSPQRPLWAIVGGSKVSSKIDLLMNLSQQVDGLIIGGAMANTFLMAQGYSVGKSLVEPNHVTIARAILDHATAEIVLPVDAIVAEKLSFDNPSITAIAPITAIPDHLSIFDAGPASCAMITDKLAAAKTIIFNGPLGVFEHPDFNIGTRRIATFLSHQTQENQILTVAGGGDTLAALAQFNLLNDLSYCSTAGGAFLEYLEGKELPGIRILLEQAS